MKISDVSKRVTQNKTTIKEIKDSLKPIRKREALKVGIWPVTVYHATLNPKIQSKTILTDSTWEFVEIYLKQNCDGSKKQKNAILYWQQARNFYQATQSLDNNSKPLTIYYCLLNATKALLETKKIPYSFAHGVAGRSSNGHNNIKNEFVRLKTKGVLSGLCNYLEEPVRPISVQEPHEEYSIKDIFYNLAFIHRAYNVTYSNSAELFIPILNPQLVRDKSINRAWLQFELEPEHSNKTTLSRIFHLKYEREKITDNSEGFIIRHKKRFEWDVVRNVPDSANKLRLDNYIKTRRKEFQYIYSANELWYLKRNDLIPGVINHSPLGRVIN